MFDAELLADMMVPDRIAVSKVLPWMNGTTVSLDEDQRVQAFHMSAILSHDDRYKTVNICSLSLESWYNVLDRLDKYVSAKQLNRYYEAAFSDLVAEGKLSFDAIFFNEKRWYEIDSLEDLDAAEEHFNENGQVIPC